MGLLSEFSHRQARDGQIAVPFQRLCWIHDNISAPFRQATTSCGDAHGQTQDRAVPHSGTAQPVKKVNTSVTVTRCRQISNRKSASPFGTLNGAKPLRSDFRAILLAKSLPYTLERPGGLLTARPVRECKSQKSGQGHFLTRRSHPVARMASGIVFIWSYGSD